MADEIGGDTVGDQVADKEGELGELRSVVGEFHVAERNKEKSPRPDTLNLLFTALGFTLRAFRVAKQRRTRTLGGAR